MAKKKALTDFLTSQEFSDGGRNFERPIFRNSKIADEGSKFQIVKFENGCCFEFEN